MGGEISLEVVLKIVAVLVGGIGIFKLIDGLKDFFPKFFEANPNVSRWINLLSSAALGLLVCFGGEHPIAGVGVMGMIQCAIPVIATALIAAGQHDQESKKLKALSGGGQ